MQLHADYHDIWNNPRSLRHPRSTTSALPIYQDERSRIRPVDNRAEAADKAENGSYKGADCNATFAMIRKCSLACPLRPRTSSLVGAHSDWCKSGYSAVPHYRTLECHRPRTDVDFPSLAKALRLNNLDFTFFTVLIRILERLHLESFIYDGVDAWMRVRVPLGTHALHIIILSDLYRDCIRSTRVVPYV